ncbi:DNA-processing protein DprA [Psychromonas sp. L1A2]|uniref:DNA-processing protein DprA n=1 Tax=Psychromonas sp. L1A2 TaxID=2686356 RepID=UPI00135ABD1F
MALDAIPALQKRKIFTLLSHYSIEQLFQLNKQQLTALHLKPEQITAFLQPNKAHIQSCLDWQENADDRNIISYGDQRYPPLLKQISSPPLLLFTQGNLTLLNSPQIAIIGSRSCTPYGKEKAHDLAQQLSKVGLTITSGLAIGVDGMAHQGALTEIGSTVAVLGTGLNNIYPKRHTSLATAIREKGLLISEFWPDTPAYPSNFPRRNRIISGLSLGTLVIEASLRSGSLITARYAAEQNREVFALPGSVDNPQACGCLKLIQQGAKLILNSDDIINEFPALNLLQSTAIAQPYPAKSQSPLLSLIDYNLTSFETILARSGMDVVSLQNELIELEINGIINVQPQGYTKLKG